VPFGPAILNRDILAGNIAGPFQALQKGGEVGSITLWVCTIHEA